MYGSIRIDPLSIARSWVGLGQMMGARLRVINVVIVDVA